VKSLCENVVSVSSAEPEVVSTSIEGEKMGVKYGTQRPAQEVR
jgi:hypothetical protein